jgi:hypothetical protein
VQFRFIENSLSKLVKDKLGSVGVQEVTWEKGIDHHLVTFI